MKKNIFILLIIILLAINFGYSQNRVKGTDFSSFSIEEENDTIDFAIADTVFDIQKPMLLFCQGSLPVPLFVDVGNNRIVPLQLGNFDLKEMRKYYHVVVISMPKTPMIAKMENLTQQYYYVKDTATRKISDAFFLADNMANYVRRANVVIAYLQKKDFIESSKLVVCGHSQGSRVAVMLAASNKAITQLGLFSYSYENRIDEILRKARVAATKGEITWYEADSIQENYYAFYRKICNDDSLKVQPSLTSWRSFSKTTINELSHLKIPVYIAYGSEDVGCVDTDLIPLYFIEQGKSNYVVRRYPGLEHNFFPLVDGHPDHKNGEWANVMNAFIDWTLEE